MAEGDEETPETPPTPEPGPMTHRARRAARAGRQELSWKTLSRENSGLRNSVKRLERRNAILEAQLKEKYERRATEPPAPETIDTVETLQENVRKQYLYLLAKPEVIKDIERIIRSTNDKVGREMLHTLMAHVIAPEKEPSRGPASITLINKIARGSGEVAQAIEVTPALKQIGSHGS